MMRRRSRTSPDLSHPRAAKLLSSDELLLLDLLEGVELRLGGAVDHLGVELEGTAGLQADLVQPPVVELSLHHHGTGWGKVCRGYIRKHMLGIIMDQFMVIEKGGLSRVFIAELSIKVSILFLFLGFNKTRKGRNYSISILYGSVP